MRSELHMARRRAAEENRGWSPGHRRSREDGVGGGDSTLVATAGVPPTAAEWKLGGGVPFFTPDLDRGRGLELVG